MSPAEDSSQSKSKEQIISEVARATYLSNDVVTDVVNEYLRAIRREVVRTGWLTIKGFFAVRTSVKKAHVRKDIHTGKDTQFPESEYLRVSLSKQLRDEFQALRRRDSDSAPEGPSAPHSPVQHAYEYDDDDFDADLEDMLSEEEL